MTGQGTAAYGGQSLQKLYQGTTSSLDAVDGSASYTLAQVRATLCALVAGQNSGTVRTLDFAGSFGDGDHSDHHAVAYLVRDAVAASAPRATLVGYRGYSTSESPVNVTGADYTAKAAAFDAYAPSDWKLQCRTAAACVSGSHADLEGAWLQRQYTLVGTGTPDRDTDRYPDRDTDRYSDGDTDRYSDGDTDRYSDGDADRYSDGYSHGDADGYSHGDADGYSHGDADGYSHGDADGYSHGDADGEAVGSGGGFGVGVGVE